MNAFEYLHYTYLCIGNGVYVNERGVGGGFATHMHVVARGAGGLLTGGGGIRGDINVHIFIYIHT
jgi:hypothetical protein